MTIGRTGARLPPVWLLGTMTVCNGSFAGVLLVTIPQLLAAIGTPEPRIAQITSIAMLPGVFGFLLAPVLDIRFSRRAYVIGLALLQATALSLSLNMLHHTRVLTACMLLCNVGYYLFTPAVAGWFGTLVAGRDEPRLGAWLAAGSVAGFGVMSALAIVLLRALPSPAGLAIIVCLALSPLAITPFVPAPAPDRRLSREGFGRLAQDLAKVIREPYVLRLLTLFAVPAATFALTNTLGGLGKDFHASEGFVGLIGGLGVTAGGVFGALVAPIFARRFPPLALYISIGVAGALFTLCLLAPPRTPALFAAAMVGENVFQSAAFAMIYVLALQSIGDNNPFAATQFAFINAAAALPLTYMQYVDGKAYGWRGLAGAFEADAGLSLAACLGMALLFATRWRKSLTPDRLS